MGTQQILMIILSVIIVGTAIAVGIQMFDTQHENATRQALAAELMQQMSMVRAWYRVPTSQGGGGNRTGSYDFTNISLTIANYITGQNITSAAGGTATYDNLLGTFVISATGSLANGTQRINILATSAVSPTIQARINFLIQGNEPDAVVEQL